LGDVAEYEGHHPNLHLHDWNQVCVELSTHAIKGLSENDFIMAAKIDQILEDNAPSL
jgi:4a-hydroxytetrahydrobiopterin dehydratase